MDKEKEIEEMTEFIGKTISVRQEGDRFPLTVLTRDFLAKRIINEGYRKADEVRKEMRGEIERVKAALADAVRSFTRMETLYKLKCDEIAGLTGKVEALQQDNENLLRSLEEGRESVKKAKCETAKDIVDLLIQHDDGDSNTEAIELIVKRYGLQEYIKENFSVRSEDDDE